MHESELNEETRSPSPRNPAARTDADDPDVQTSPHSEADDDEDFQDDGLPVPTGDEARAVLESLLFSATSPLSEKRLCRLLNDIEPGQLRELIQDLQNDYERAGRGITLMEVAGGFQLATRPEYAEWVYRLHRHRKRSALTPAVLETLAIIAYKQPIVRAEVESIRGVDCGGILRQLQDAGLVEVVGRREVVGRPPLYGTTDLFLKSFGLKRLSDLPSLEELQTLMAQAAGEETEPIEAPADEAASEDEQADNPAREDEESGTEQNP